MVDAMKAKGDKSNCLEKLPVPSWDGDRKSYATWRFEFNRCMTKYSQDSDEQLQRLRLALPKQLFWSNQIKYCQTIEQAWEFLDTEFQNKRKLMDDILKDITNLKPVRSDSKSLARYAARIMSFANNMKLNGCPVSDSTEAPFVMSQLLSKLESQDNVEFGREMNRSKKEENVSNLIEWLNNEATLRSRGKPTAECKSESHASEASSEDDECPLGCASKPLLPACPHYQAASVDEKWEIVKQNKRCRKCLKSHHTNNCFKPDGTTCNKCDRRHHRSLHNDSYTPKPRNHSSSPMNPEAPPFTSHSTHTSSNHVHRNASKLPGICPVQKVKIKDEQGNQTEVVAMIDSGSNPTSFPRVLQRSSASRGVKRI